MAVDLEELAVAGRVAEHGGGEDLGDRRRNAELCDDRVEHERAPSQVSDDPLQEPRSADRDVLLVVQHGLGGSHVDDAAEFGLEELVAVLGLERRGPLDDLAGDGDVVGVEQRGEVGGQRLAVGILEATDLVVDRE
ncbi:hypothetical protein ENSA7_81680 [Enhygromyxa salina]|uniref:Uncharacterized protein n=1 Tax=Enhygromyxa salina TaxID=215803 RepID=A0A2S9XHC4_9BACT|nr:hypothetical protein ENSA7_81680 [Enhygromyxa salina]